MEDFSTYSNEKLQEHYENLSKKLSSIFTEEKFLDSKESPLSRISKAIDPKEKTETVTKNFYDFLIEYLKRKFKELAIAHYLYMEKANDFGNMGEQRISISFCRNLLKIPTDREVTQFDADRFRRLIDEYDEKLGKKSADYYRGYLQKYELDLFGVKIKSHSFVDLNKYLEKIGFEYFLYTTYKVLPQFILTKVKKLPIKEYSVYITAEEIVRSPTMVLSIAAEGYEGKITLIRRESCEVIFFNKWQKFFEQSKLELKKALNHQNSAIREGVKQKALALYQAKTADDVKKIKKLFIDEMIDGIVWHEVGHQVGEAQLDKVLRSIGTYFVNSDSPLCVLKEAIADWAPAKDQLKGAFTRFLEIAKKDQVKATRDIYVYLSDNWFVDEEEEFMSLQTDILTALTLHFINSDGSVDFERLEKEHEKIYGFILKVYDLIANKIYDVFKTAQYQVGIHLLDYSKLEKEMEKLYKDSVNARPLEELRYYNPFWINMFAYLRKFSPDGQKKLDQTLEETAGSMRQLVLKNITKGDTGKYNNSLREYIYQRYKEMGVLQERKKVDYRQAVINACEKMKMPEKVKNKVEQQFKEIVESNKNYDISISYEGKPDPFLATVQEIMLKTGLGDINAGMILGELYDTDEPIEKRKEYIKNELEGIRDQIESEMYMEVEILKVNKKHNIKPMVEELIGAIDFLSGGKLKEKIKEIRFEDIKNEALFEVFVPLKRGFMDWNTSQAVWRINQDLRPEEFTMQWTIDREFIEALVEEYLK